MTELNPKPLDGMTAGISISIDEESSARRGFTPSLINDATVRLASALVSQGACVLFGQDWRTDGVMQAILGLVLQLRSPGNKDERPLLRNLLPYPKQPSLSREELDRFRAILSVESAGLPSGVEPAAATPALALTHMRRRLNEESTVRICAGGKIHGWTGALPGIVEEAGLALQTQKPLYLLALLGGAAAQLALAVKGEPMPEDFCQTAPGAPRAPQAGEIWSRFQEAGIAGLRNGLSAEQNLDLIRTPSIEHATSLILYGMGRVKRGQVSGG